MKENLTQILMNEAIREWMAKVRTVLPQTDAERPVTWIAAERLARDHGRMVRLVELLREHRLVLSCRVQEEAGLLILVAYHRHGSSADFLLDTAEAYFREKDCGGFLFLCRMQASINTYDECKYSINSLVYWVTYVHNVVYSFYRSMIYCYINSTQRCAGSIVIDIIPTNGADKRKFFPFAPYFPVTNVIKRYFYPYFPAIIGIKGYSFPYFPYLSGIMKIKTALYSLFSRLDWHKTVVFPCLGEIYEGIRSLSWEIPVT